MLTSANGRRNETVAFFAQEVLLSVLVRIRIFASQARERKRLLSYLLSESERARRAKAAARERAWSVEATVKGRLWRGAYVDRVQRIESDLFAL